MSCQEHQHKGCGRGRSEIWDKEICQLLSPHYCYSCRECVSVTLVCFWTTWPKNGDAHISWKDNVTEGSQVGIAKLVYWGHPLLPCVMKRGLYWRFVQKLWDNMKGRNISHSSLTTINYTNQNKKKISIITTKFGTSNNHKLILNLPCLDLERHSPPLYNILCSSLDRSDVSMALSQIYQKREFQKFWFFIPKLKLWDTITFLKMYIMSWVKAIFCKTFENIMFRFHIKLLIKTWIGTPNNTLSE